MAIPIPSSTGAGHLPSMSARSKKKMAVTPLRGQGGKKGTFLLLEGRSLISWTAGGRSSPKRKEESCCIGQQKGTLSLVKKKKIVGGKGLREAVLEKEKGGF